MKPARFDYLAPQRTAEVVELLARHADDVKLLAGGMSLGPLLNLRLSAPAVIIDVNPVTELAYGRVDEHGWLRIGAMWRQRSLERSAVVAAGWPLLTEAVAWVAHPTVRNRGTVGGSLSHADPSAELPTVALALDASFVVASSRGRRTIAARDFFVTFLATALEEDELLVEVRFPPSAGAGHAWAEHATRRGDFAQVGVACVVEPRPDDTVGSVRVALGGIGDTPVRVSDALAAELSGHRLDDRTARDFADQVAREVEPSEDLLAGVEYKRRLIRHLLPGALQAAGGRMGQQHGLD